MTAEEKQAAPKTKLGWTIISFVCPVGAVALAFVVGRSMKDEEVAMRIVGIGGYAFVVLAVVALIGAFVRKEKLRWLTLLPLILLAALFGLGVSFP